MHEEVKDYFLKHVGSYIHALRYSAILLTDFIQVTVNPMTHLTYGKGPRGSERLRKSLASFCNNKFKAYKKVTSDEVIVLPGVGSTMDSMVWAICNEGEGILIPQPLYMGTYSSYVSLRVEYNWVRRISIRHTRQKQREDRASQLPGY